VLFVNWNYIFVQFLEKYMGAKGTDYPVQHCYTLKSRIQLVLFNLCVISLGSERRKCPLTLV
jgi:hypothetical protein